MDSKEMAPGDIERRSFEIITEELGGHTFPPLEEPVVKRVIHTTADFSYADSLVFTHDATHCALDALRAGATVITDTNMALAGISKPALAKLGCKAVCYMADPDVAAAARAAGTTRAVASMDKACGIEGPLIVAVGNAPTALLRLAELMDAGKIAPALVVGVPVGFVNVVEAKEELLARRVPAIVARGRKGGSTVAAAIMNALLYQITRPGGPRAASCANGRAGRESPPVPTRQPSTEASFWASFRASRYMRAGSTRPTWSASFPARASSSTPRTPSLRSQAATSEPLRSP